MSDTRGHAGSGERFSLAQLATLLEANALGPETWVSGVARLEEAGETDLAFAEGAPALNQAATSAAGIILAQSPVPGRQGAQLLHPSPRAAFYRLLEHLYPPRQAKAGLHPTAVIADEAAVEDGVEVGAFVRVGAGAHIASGCILDTGVVIEEGVELGPSCVIGPRVVIHSGSRLGAGVQVGAGTVIGSRGFGYHFDGVRHRPIPQVGIVEIGDDVFIGAGCTIDRAMLGATRIGAGSRIDNLVHIAHNVSIGERCVIAAQTGVSGSSSLGADVILAGQVGVADHTRIGNGVVVAAQSGVRGRVAAGAVVAGTPQLPVAIWRRVVTSLPYVPELVRVFRREQRGRRSDDPELEQG